MATSVNSYDKSLNSYNLHYEQIGKEVKCIKDELPFEIPDSWEWCRLGNIGEYRKGPFGSSLTKSMFVPKSQNTVKVYEQKNAIQKNAKLGDYYITQQYFEQKMKSFSVHAGDIIVSCAGTIGETYVLPQKIEPGIINQALMRMRIYSPINVDYFLLYFDYIIKQTSIKNSKGSAIKNIPPFDVFKRILFPVPPLKEQNRIVNKIQEIEFLLKKYQIVEEQLYELNSNIKNQLKKSILQYAIEGKLVPQDPNDEPASVLLDRIRKEKQNLIAEGKIKKDKNESIIYRRDNSYYEKFNGIERCIEEEIPYIIPDSWEWIRLGSALINRDSERIPLSVSERAKLEKKYDYYGASGVIDKVDKYLFDKPLLLVGEDGANLLLRSKPIAFIANGKYWVNNHAHVLDSCSDLLLEYVEIYINSQNLSPYVTGTAQPKMNQEKMNSILIPIPPYNEQNRIITESKKIYSILK